MSSRLIAKRNYTSPAQLCTDLSEPNDVGSHLISYYEFSRDKLSDDIRSQIIINNNNNYDHMFGTECSMNVYVQNNNTSPKINT